MKKLPVMLIVAGTAMLVLAAIGGPVAAQSEQVCSGTKVDVGNLPATILGVQVSLVDENTVRFNIVEGTTVVVCVKSGTAGPEQFTITADTDITTSTGQDVSHVSVISVTIPTTPPPTTPPPTTPPPTTPPPTTPPPVTTTPPPVTTTPPPATTTPPPPPEETTTPPSPVGGPGPGPKQGPPNKLAFTGPEDLFRIGLAALGFLSSGTGLLMMGYRRKNGGIELPPE
jgi:hypothetical protein